MLGSPNHNKPVFGLISNGANFKFLKLIREDHPIYSESISFSWDREDDLYTVLRILKKMAQIV